MRISKANFVNSREAVANNVAGNLDRSLEMIGGSFKERATTIPKGSRAKRLEARSKSQKGRYVQCDLIKWSQLCRKV